MPGPGPAAGQLREDGPRPGAVLEQQLRADVVAGIGAAVAAVTVGFATATVPAFATTGQRGTTPATPTLTIYLAPANKGGSDSHTGLTTASPILTLTRAQQVLAQKKPNTDVQVRIDEGTYVAGETDWTFYIPGHTISFMPAEAIKVRDRSDFNVVEHNTFIATGGVSAYRDQFCDQACVSKNPGTSRQCAS